MIGNLHFRVSDNDIKELFKEFGQIKRAAVHYDKSGRSLGNAEVVFANRISAIKAKDKYDDVLLDGKWLALWRVRKLWNWMPRRSYQTILWKSLFTNRLSSRRRSQDENHLGHR